MKNDISSVMGKLTGAELGKLNIKDDIGIFTGIDRTYSQDDFDIALSKQDRSNKVKYFDYAILTMELKIIILVFKGIVENISKMFLIINTTRNSACWCESINLSCQKLTVERISNHCEDGPGDHESYLRDMFIMFYDELIDTKEYISKIYAHIKESIIMYFGYRDLIKGLADRLELPELEAVIGDDDLSCIENLNMWSFDKELFQKIDIEELEQKKQIDIKEKIDNIMTWIEN